MNIDKYQLLSGGVYVDYMTPKDKIDTLLKSLRPLKTPVDLVRIGPNGDGGYLLPNDFGGIETCYSPGVGSTSDFEVDLLRRGIKSHLMDASVKRPADIDIASFTSKFLGSTNTIGEITLSRWMELNGDSIRKSDLLLQMDIEGAEYECIISTPIEDLHKFRIISIEIHDIEAWGCPQFFKLVESFFLKLLNSFYVVHLHPNNCCGLVDMHGTLIPRVFEVTFYRKDRVSTLSGYNQIPNPLDCPNIAEIPALEFPAVTLGILTDSSSSEPQEHIFYCDGGLANRLTTLLVALYVNSMKNSRVRISWPVNNWCGAHIESLFDMRGIAFDTHDLKYYEFAGQKYQYIIHENQLHFDILFRHPDSIETIQEFLTFFENEKKPVFYYNNLFPKFIKDELFKEVFSHFNVNQSIIDIVNNFCESNAISKSVHGAHIRVTDFPGKIDPDIIYDHISKSDMNFFVCTDDFDVSKRFSKLKNCCIYEKSNYPTKLNDQIDWNDTITDQQGRVFNFNVSRTESSVIEALIDMLILSRTTVLNITESTFESFSRFISKFN